MTPDDDGETNSWRVTNLVLSEFGDPLETTIANSLEIGDPAVVVTTTTADLVLPPMTKVDCISSIAPATLSVVDQTDLVDEEVVIDRYAVLDAVLNRSTRHDVLNARAISRRNETISSVVPKPEPVLLDDEGESDSRPFDVVLPEDVAGAQSQPTSVGRDDPPRDSNSRPLAGRRVPAPLFSELRRRRIGA